MTTTLNGKTRPATDEGQATEQPMRASDADRLATVRVLQDAVARGLLTPDEGSNRMAAAFAAVHLSELGPLTADLPPAPGKPPPPGWQPLAIMAMEQVRASLNAPTTGRLSPARIAGAVVVAILVLAIIGSIADAVFWDGGGGGHHHGHFELDD